MDPVHHLQIIGEAYWTGKLPQQTCEQVKAIMSPKVFTVDEETPVEEIASLMIHHNIKRLPVMRAGKLAGIVSRADIVRAVAMGKHIALHTPVYDL